MLQGSEDGAGWEDLVTLRVQWENLVTMPEEEAWSERWLGFVPGEERSFRYYRIEISDPRFLSLAEVELYSGESPAPTHPPAPSPTPPPPPTPASVPEPTPGLLTPAESNDGSFESWAARDGVLPE